MFFWIFSGVFLFFALIAAIIGLVKGRKFIWQYSFARLISVIVAAVASMISSSLLCWLVSSLLYKTLRNASVVSADISQLITSIPTLEYMIRAVFAALIAPMVFIILFFVFKKLFGFLVRRICHGLVRVRQKHLEKKCAKKGIPVPERKMWQEEPMEDGERRMSRRARRKRKFNKLYGEFRVPHFSPVGALCGIACSLMVYCVLLIPLVGGIGILSNAASLTRIAPDNAVMQTIDEIATGANKNVGTVTVRAVGGDLIYSGLTTYPVNGRLVSLHVQNVYFIGYGKSVFL